MLCHIIYPFQNIITNIKANIIFIEILFISRILFDHILSIVLIQKYIIHCTHISKFNTVVDSEFHIHVYKFQHFYSIIHCRQLQQVKYNTNKINRGISNSMNSNDLKDSYDYVHLKFGNILTLIKFVGLSACA